MRVTRWGVLVLTGALWLAPLVGAEERSGTVEEILAVLADKGLIDEAQHESLLAKHYREQAHEAAAPDVAEGLLEGWNWSGDARIRYEFFHFNGNPIQPEADNRYRFRYRVRLGFWKQLNDTFKFGMRLASGEGGGNSTNTSFGRPGTDFDPDPIFIDQAWIQAKLPDCGCGLETTLTAGKVGNPYLWKHGMGDAVAFDSDFTPEGAYLRTAWEPSEGSELSAIVGGFILEEDSSEADPKLIATQLRGETSLGGGISTGAKATWYEWRSLGANNDAFIMRSLGFGNLSSAFDGRARVLDFQGFATLADEVWPTTLYGVYARNTGADSALLNGFAIDDEDTAWGAGIEVGDSKQWLELGFGWFHVEANSVVASFTDSDLFDGFTNREGWTIYGSKQIAKNTTFQFSYFDDDEIRSTGNGAGPFATSARSANRTRGRLDLVVKY